MNNKEVYQKTLCFSIRRLVWDALVLILIAALTGGGFLLAERMTDKGLAGLAIGLVIGIILAAIILRFVSYTYKAGQIAMMTKGVTEGELPGDVIGEGKKIVKERFTTIALYFAATGVIKGIFNQLGRVITNVGEKIGGDTGSTVGSAISTAIQVVVGYLCDCCLGWVFYRSEISAGKATCEGAVLFFKHGKTLAKNLGRMFGFGLASLAAIGGAFTGIFYLIGSRFPAAFEALSREVTQAFVNSGKTVPLNMDNPATLTLVCAAIAALMIWSIIHSTFIRPFILVGVLRNYMESGIEDIPSEESFALLDSKSPKFKKLHAELG